jgi:hypothetical protein
MTPVRICADWASGSTSVSVNIAAYAVGSNLIGKLNDWLGASTTPLQMRYSLLICPAACVLAALMLWLGSRSLGRESAPDKLIQLVADPSEV